MQVQLPPPTQLRVVYNAGQGHPAQYMLWENAHLVCARSGQYVLRQCTAPGTPLVAYGEAICGKKLVGDDRKRPGKLLSLAEEGVVCGVFFKAGTTVATVRIESQPRKAGNACIGFSVLALTCSH
jgi:hypothetical protein